MHKISIVIPARNEEKNINRLLLALMSLKDKGYDYEAVVVDDSEDATAVVAESLGAKVIIGQRKGLGQAIIDGIYGSSGDIIVVMDADLSHSPQSIPQLIHPVLRQGYDMAIGSRYCTGGSTVGWSFKRKLISKVAGLLAYPITFIWDNTSGFFAVRRTLLDGVQLRADSWKIMLEILVRANPTAVMEVPITFADRQEGKSKFTMKEAKRYLVHIIKLALHKYRAVIKFGLVGISGALLHFLLLYTLTDIAGMWYIFSAIMSIILASTWNYGWNHRLTFRDRQISNHIIGWTKYQVMSGITDAMYLGLLALLVEIAGLWYMLGAFLSALFIFPIKFAVASSMIWSKKISVKDADYEWCAFFKGSPIQKWWKQSIAKTVWHWVPPDESGSVLDVGSGSSPIIARYDNALGVDVNKDKVAFMKAKLPHIAFDTIMPDSHKQYDNVLCIEVLEHLENPEAMVASLSRLLKSGGKAVIATPDYSKMLWHLAEKFTPYKAEHVVKFTRRTLEEMFKRHNLQPVKYRYVAGCDLCEMFIKVA